jgi:hypothetical protein
MVVSAMFSLADNKHTYSHRAYLHSPSFVADSCIVISRTSPNRRVSKTVKNVPYKHPTLPGYPTMLEKAQTSTWKNVFWWCRAHKHRQEWSWVGAIARTEHIPSSAKPFNHLILSAIKKQLLTMKISFTQPLASLGFFGRIRKTAAMCNSIA